MSDADNLYQKAGILLVVIPLLGTITVKMSRIDILSLCFLRVNVFLFYLAFLITSVALTISVIFLLFCIHPRQYKNLGSIDVWHKWRDDYKKYLDDKGESIKDTDSIGDAMYENITLRLIEAQPINAEINEKRRKAFKRSIQSTTVALISIGLQTFFSIILKIPRSMKMADDKKEETPTPPPPPPPNKNKTVEHTGEYYSQRGNNNE
jgi:hypothetical protein